VTRLDPTLRSAPGPSSAGAARLQVDGVHTLNEAEGLEVIDCVGWRSRFKR